MHMSVYVIAYCVDNRKIGTFASRCNALHEIPPRTYTRSQRTCTQKHTEGTVLTITLECTADRPTCTHGLAARRSDQ